MSAGALKKRFLSSPQFAVVGASKDQSKFGTKVLKWYIGRKMRVTPVHPRECDLEGLRTVSSIADLPAPSETSISVITPPKVTLGILEQAKSLEVPTVWLQPGAADELVNSWIRDNGWQDRVLHDGPCVLEEGDNVLRSLL